MKKYTFLGGVLLLFLTLVACDLGSTPPTDPPKSNATNPNAAASGGNLDCTKDADGNLLPYTEACQEIVARYKLMNDPNKIGYFYGFGYTANPIIEYITKGAVLPVNDVVSSPEYKDSCFTGGSGGAYGCAVPLPKQQPDGTYGTNGDAMFGWTATGVYFEFSGGLHFWSTEPLDFKGQVIVGCVAGVKGC